ncbi:unnamed protein product [Protopolystoma xenopodis]|uniref:CNH domain-containing protein n=1 Tax=Protopolystoma xenopodis TaxID=117903 RepID=A0A3S5A6F7_9PLAT|nr:unnamed protein product [Protopolystoma xenopodis]
MNLEPIRISEIKACSQFVCGFSHGGHTYLVACAVTRGHRSSIWLFEIARVRGRHRGLREITFPAPVQSLGLVRNGDWLAVGGPSHFALYRVWSDQQQQQQIQMQGKLIYSLHLPSYFVSYMNLIDRFPNLN